jgi:hypothetical protein
VKRRRVVVAGVSRAPTKIHQTQFVSDWSQMPHKNISASRTSFDIKSTAAHILNKIDNRIAVLQYHRYVVYVLIVFSASLDVFLILWILATTRGPKS